MWALVNGSLVPAEQARVSLVDRRFLYGDAAFETLAAYRGHIFRVAPHLQRLSQSLQALGIAPPCSAQKLEHDLYFVLEHNRAEDAILRICVSRSAEAAQLDAHGAASGYSIFVDPPRAIPFQIDRRGVRLVAVSLRRMRQGPMPTRAGTANHLNSVLALAEAVERGGDEALLFDTRGFIAEGAYSNVFFVSAGAVVTPGLESGVAAGITRAAILEVVRRQGMPAAETLVEPSTLSEASEMFITNTVGGVVPVHSVAQRVFGAPGPLTTRIAHWYWELVAQEAGHARTQTSASQPAAPLPG